ncbi:hypothetical protein ACRS85_15015 [Pluralibacter gergoviae]
MGIVFLGNRLEVYHLITLGLIIFGIGCCSTKKPGPARKVRP